MSSMNPHHLAQRVYEALAQHRTEHGAHVLDTHDSDEVIPLIEVAITNALGEQAGLSTPKPPNLMTKEELRNANYDDRGTIADLRLTLLSVLAHLEGRSDMSTDGNWEPLMIDLIRKRVGWPPRDA